MAVYRNTGGFSDVDVGDSWAQFARPDPTRYATWFEDFTNYDKTQGNAKYTLTQTNGVDTIVGPTGVLVLTLGGADNDLAQLYLTDAPFQLTANKAMFFKARVKIDKGSTGTIGQEEMVIGLTSAQTSTNFMNAGGTAVAFDDGVAFVIYDGVTSINAMSVNTDVVSVASNIYTYADATWMVLSIYFDGDVLYFYIDNVLKATLDVSFPTAVLTPMIFIKAGEAKAKVLSVDYLMLSVER